MEHNPKEIGYGQHGPLIWRGGEDPQEFYSKAKQASSFVHDHFHVLLNQRERGCLEVISPVDIEALAVMQIEQFFNENIQDGQCNFVLVVAGVELREVLLSGLERYKVHHITTIECQSHPILCVGSRTTAAELGPIFNVVNQEGRVVEHGDDFAYGGYCVVVVDGKVQVVEASNELGSDIAVCSRNRRKIIVGLAKGGRNHLRLRVDEAIDEIHETEGTEEIGMETGTETVLPNGSLKTQTLVNG